MKITFLGTCHGHPEKNRDYTSIAIETGGKVYLIDAGAAVANKMLDNDISIANLKSVFITHIHGDHVNGLLRLVDVLGWASRFYDGVSVDYYFPEARGIKEIKELISVVKAPFSEEKNVFHVYPENFVYDDGLLKLTVIPNAHLCERSHPSYSFFIEAEGKKILFTGDMSQDLKYDDFPSVAKTEELDLLISELAHFDFDVLSPHIMECKTKKLYITHVKYPEIRTPIIEKANLSGEFPFPIFSANDGDVVEL